MANQDLGLAAPARVAVEEARYRGRCGTDADSLAAPQPDPRARDEMCLFILGACERTARCTCEPAVAGKDLRGVCMCIDLVFSYSIDATNCLFTESDALRSRFFPPDPLLQRAFDPRVAAHVRGERGAGGGRPAGRRERPLGERSQHPP